MGTVRPDVHELSSSIRFSSSSGPFRIPARPEAPSLLQPVSESQRHRRIGAGLELISTSYDLSSVQPHKGSREEANRIQGGVLVLQDSRALFRFIPTKFLRKGLEMDSPLHRLYQGSVHVSYGYDRFRTWIFESCLPLFLG